MSDKPKTAVRFSQLYLPAQELLPDSKRLRNRLGAFLERMVEDTRWRDRIGTAIREELGVETPYQYGTAFDEFFAECELRDLLDTITIVYDVFDTTPRDPVRIRSRARSIDPASHGSKWFEFVKRAIAEEHVGYRVDDDCVVHPIVDAEFEIQRVAVIAALTEPRYKATLKEFEGAHEALERDQPDTKEAVCDVFRAVENLFKLMTNGAAQRLTRGEIESRLPGMLDKHYPQIKVRTAASKMQQSLIDWVSAGHEYRHEPGTEEPAPPPLDYAVMTMSTGAGFLRWLAEIDRTINPRS